jgi:prolipoprotein diacylglyceryltransferase
MDLNKITFISFYIDLYAVFAGIGLSLGLWITYKRIQKSKLNVNWFVYNTWHWVIGGILFGRIFSWFFSFQENWWEFFYFWKDGLLGEGILFGFLLFFLFDLIRTRQENIGKWLDIGIHGFLWGAVIVFLGNFITGNFYGKETSLPWGISYQGSNIEIVGSVHPISLYMVILLLIIIFFKNKYHRSFQKKPGTMFVFTLSSFAVSNIFIYTLYKNPLFYGAFHLEQIIYLFILLSLSGYYLFLKYR